MLFIQIFPAVMLIFLLISDVNVVIFSHEHKDHGGGLKVFYKIIKSINIFIKMPFNYIILTYQDYIHLLAIFLGQYAELLKIINSLPLRVSGDDLLQSFLDT